MNKKYKIIVVAILCLMIAVVGGLFYQKEMQTKILEEQHYQTVLIHVVHGDKSEKTFTYETEANYLGDVLYENKLIEGEDGEYGIYITMVDGETADESKQEWWCITKAGEQVNTSADLTPIKEGDTFELTLMEGYDQ